VNKFFLSGCRGAVNLANERKKGLMKNSVDCRKAGCSITFTRTIGVAALITIILAPLANAAQRRGDKPLHREDRVLAKPKQGVAGRILEPLRGNHGGKVLRRYPQVGGLEVIELEKGRDVGTVISGLRACY
jgi:hypothetical protein